jgi:hypothetical protein
MGRGKDLAEDFETVQASFDADVLAVGCCYRVQGLYQRVSVDRIRSQGVVDEFSRQVLDGTVEFQEPPGIGNLRAEGRVKGVNVATEIVLEGLLPCIRFLIPIYFGGHHRGLRIEPYGSWNLPF